MQEKIKDFRESFKNLEPSARQRVIRVGIVFILLVILLIMASRLSSYKSGAASNREKIEQLDTKKQHSIEHKKQIKKSVPSNFKKMNKAATKIINAQKIIVPATYSDIAQKTSKSYKNSVKTMKDMTLFSTDSSWNPQGNAWYTNEKWNMTLYSGVATNNDTFDVLFVVTNANGDPTMFVSCTYDISSNKFKNFSHYITETGQSEQSSIIVDSQDSPTQKRGFVDDSGKFHETDANGNALDGTKLPGASTTKKSDDDDSSDSGSSSGTSDDTDSNNYDSGSAEAGQSTDPNGVKDSDIFQSNEGND